MTAWILLIYFSYDRSYVLESIQNLKSLEECRRVSQVVKDSLERSIYTYRVDTRCIEVYTK